MAAATMIAHSMLNQDFVCLGEVMDDLGLSLPEARKEMAFVLRECRKTKLRVKSFPLMYYGDPTRAYCIVL